MKRNALLLGVLLLLVLGGGILLARWSVIARARPRFVPAKEGVLPGEYDWLQYDFLSPSPFEGGKMWVMVASKKKYHVYLYDIEKRMITGELLNAEPAFFNRDRTKLLCFQMDLARLHPMWQNIMRFLGSLHIFGDTFSHAGENPQTFWELDLKANSLTRLGRLYQGQGSGSDFKASPDFRYGYNKATGGFLRPDVYICDLENKVFRKDQLDGWPCGWWDNEHILVKGTNNDVVLYDVMARKSSVLVSQQQLKSFYADAGLTNQPGAFTPFFQWNGKENEFYLTDGNSRWSAVTSFLIKIERPDGRLRMVDREFKFEWSDHFDATGNLYLYSGRDAGMTNSAVYLRDLKTGRTRELVAPDANDTKSFSIPRFYGDKVIYLRSNAMWEIGVDGGGGQRLFPP